MPTASLIETRTAVLPLCRINARNERGSALWPSRLIVFITGATALAGQACWARVSSAVVGGTFTSSVITLSGAMAGMALGAVLAGFLLGPRNARRLLLVSVVSSAVLIAVMPWLILGIGALEGSLLIRRVLAGLLIGAAHVPLGAILPSAVSCRNESKGRLSRGGGELYALSAFGALAGAVVGGELLAPRMALDHLGLILCGVTLLSSVLALFIPDRSGHRLGEERRSGSPGRSVVPLAIAGGLGVFGMAAESAWLRIFAFYWGANTLSFAWVTASFIGGLAFGAWAASRLPEKRLGSTSIALGLAITGFALAVSASQAARLGEAFGPWNRFVLSVSMVGIPAAVSGAVFVALLGKVRRDLSPGRALAWVVGVNSAGAAAGPLVLWLASPLLPWAPKVLAFVACGYALLAIVVVPRKMRELALSAGVATAIGVFSWTVSPATPAVENYGVSSGTGPMPGLNETVVSFSRTGLISSVVVTRNTGSGNEVLWIDRGFQGDTSALGRRIPETLGELPAQLLGRQPGRAMVIGLGTGITLSRIVKAGAKHIDLAELSGGVLEANRTVLAEVNERVLERRCVRVHQTDGRQVLADATAPYDLIVTDMIFPDVVGAANLFSREFYGLARRKLSPDGVFIHWIPCFLMAPEDVSATVSAFRGAFPEGSAWIGFLGPQRVILGLAGGASPRPIPESLLSRFAFGPEGLAVLAAESSPLRDADPRIEYRSNMYRSSQEFGVENLRRIVDQMRDSEVPAGWISQGHRSVRGRIMDAWLSVARARTLEMESLQSAPGSAARKRVHEKVIELYRLAIAKAPGATDADILLQLALYERNVGALRDAAGRGDHQRVLECLSRAASSPLHGRGNMLLADELATRGYLREAMGELDRGFRKSPRSADAHIKRSLLALTLGEYVNAQESLNAARLLRPDEPKLYREVARWIAQGRSSALVPRVESVNGR